MKKGFAKSLVVPSGGLFFPLVRKEEEERHAKGKGFLQSRPSLWNPFLRRLFSSSVLRMLCAFPRSARAAQSRCGGKCRGACMENWPLDTRKSSHLSF